MRAADHLEAFLERQAAHPLRWLAALALLLVIQINPWWLPTPDAAAYLSIARSIATHHALRMLGYSHIAYPPGYPIIISPAFWLSPLPFLIISAMQCLMAIIFMLGLYRWMTYQTAPAAALLLTALVMVNVTFWIYYHRTLSELAFMATAIWAVCFLDRVLESSGRRAVCNVLSGAALLILLTLIREVGVLFGIALGVTAYLRMRRGSLSCAAAFSIVLAVTVPAVAAAAGFILYTQRTFAATHIFGTHLSAFFDSRVPLFQRLLDGIRLQICAVGRLIVPGMFKAYGHAWLDINALLYCAIFVPLALGWYRWVRRRPDPYALVAPLYLLVYALWDFDADTRYVLPMLPAVVVCLWYLVEPFKQVRLSLVAIFLGLHLTVSLAYWAFVELPRARECDAQRSFIAKLATAVRDRPGQIASTAAVPECTRLFFSLMLDRPVLPLHGNLPALDRPSILLTSLTERRADGFHTESVAGGYVLLVEDEPAAAR